MILHIPHASTNTLDKVFDCDLSLERERITDIYTDILFDHPNATKVIFPVSRLICDVERFEDDALEVMAQKGMGVCYTTNSFGKSLRNISSNGKEEIIENYYRPHHLILSLRRSGLKKRTGYFYDLMAKTSLSLFLILLEKDSCFT